MDITSRLIQVRRWLGERKRRMIYRIRFGKFKYLGSGVLISLKTDIRHPGNIYIGDRCRISEHCSIHASPSGYISMGHDTYIGPFSTVMSGDGFVEMGEWVQIGISNFITGQGGLKLGDNTLLAPMVSIVANQHTFKDLETPIRFQPEVSKGITIGKNGWMGVGVTVLDGVTVGDHVVIGANSVVSKDLPSYCVAVGTPAKVIKVLQ